jgi:hypothetical protein
VGKGHLLSIECKRRVKSGHRKDLSKGHLLPVKYRKRVKLEHQINLS